MIFNFVAVEAYKNILTPNISQITVHVYIHTCIHVLIQQIWDKSTLKVLKVLEGHKTGVNCLQYNKEVIYSSDDLTVKLVHSVHDVPAYA